MNRPTEPSMDRVLHDLQERAKELTCLYRVDEVLNRSHLAVEEMVRRVLAVLPSG